MLLNSGHGRKRNWGFCKAAQHPADPQTGGAESQVWRSAVAPMEDNMEMSWDQVAHRNVLSPYVFEAGNRDPPVSNSAVPFGKGFWKS